MLELMSGTLFSVIQESWSYIAIYLSMGNFIAIYDYLLYMYIGLFTCAMFLGVLYAHYTSLLYLITQISMCGTIAVVRIHLFHYPHFPFIQYKKQPPRQTVAIKCSLWEQVLREQDLFNPLLFQKQKLLALAWTLHPWKSSYAPFINRIYRKIKQLLSDFSVF